MGNCFLQRSGRSLPSDITLLLYGCRDATENLFAAETNAGDDEDDDDAVLTRVVAFSRQEGRPRRYVQDLVRGEAAAEVDRLVMDMQGGVFVCGTVRMSFPF